MSKDWSESELVVCVDAYLDMAKRSSLEQPFVKKKIYSELARETGRTAKSIELRMQNISAVVMGLDRQWLSGLAPAINVGSNVEDKLAKALQGHPDFKFLLPLDRISYKLKLPAMREWLIHIAHARGTVSYGEMMLAFDVDRFSLRHAMDHLGHAANTNGEPILTALIVSKATQRCSAGLESEFGIQDDALERQKLYEFWAGTAASTAVVAPSAFSSLKERAARFASTEIRPDQAAFRRRVFERYQGLCAISSYSVDKVLDAAHRKGRGWREGHNEASDGLLLRKDLHALYDNDLLTISEDGVVSLNPRVSKDYAELDGCKIKDW